MTVVDGGVKVSVKRLRISAALLAAALFAAGFAVTFTQQLHTDLVFNRSIFSIFCIVTGGILVAAAFALADLQAKPELLVAGGVSLAAGVRAMFATSTADLAIDVTIWAAVIAVTGIVAWVRFRVREALVVAVLAGLLAVILALGARELPAVMGFFGGFAIIVAVYVAIAAVDTRTRHQVASN